MLGDSEGIYWIEATLEPFGKSWKRDEKGIFLHLWHRKIESLDLFQQNSLTLKVEGLDRV